MWKLVVSDGSDNPLLFSTNNFVGRQIWKFYSNLGTPEELQQIQEAQQNFTRNRFHVKTSSDHFKNFQDQFPHKNQDNKDLKPDMKALIHGIIELIKENQTDVFKIQSLKLREDENITKEHVEIALRKALQFSCALQASDGHWPNEFSGELFLTPPLIICLYITKMLDTVFSEEHRKEIQRYIYNHQNEDGGWGLHVEGNSTMLCTTLNYIALRLLDQQLSDEAVSKGQKWIIDHGGAIHNQIWGKLYLSLLGVYEWEGCNPVPPEIFLLPSFLPFSAEKLWCYFRTFYGPIAYLYGKKFVGPITNVIVELRNELYIQPYHQINWNEARHLCLKEDSYVHHSLVRNMLFDGFYYIGETLLNCWPFSKLREKALHRVMNIVHFEDQQSRFLSHCCLVKVLNMIAYWAEDPTQEAFKSHLARLPDYLWVAEDGMKMMNLGSQLWDSVFYVQAIIASNLTKEYGIVLGKANEFIKQSQIKENPPGKFKDTLRYISKGAWSVADQDQGWQVSDCTAEALTALMLLSKLQPEVVGNCVESQRLYDAVDFLLTLQSKNGGIPAWEPAASSRWLEILNPTEAFDDVMVETEHVECTASVIESLVLFQKVHQEYRKKEVETAIAKATYYLEITQNSDGSWYGSWGICYLYGTFFALRGLAAVGKTYKNSKIVSKGCDFLLSKQLISGGWGESYMSGGNMRCTPLQENKTNLVQTAWALIGLIYAGQAERDINPLQKAVKLLINSQEKTGEFPQQNLTGASIRTCMLHYAAHRNIFPLWALGLYKNHVMNN